MKLLAQTVVYDGSRYGFNITVVFPEDCECEPVINCETNHLDPEAVVRLAFTQDACGNLAITFMNCDGTVAPDEQNGEPQ